MTVMVQLAVFGICLIKKKKITQNMIYLVRLLVHLEKKIRRENLEIISSLKVVRGSDLC